MSIFETIKDKLNSAYDKSKSFVVDNKKAIVQAPIKAVLPQGLPTVFEKVSNYVNKQPELVQAKEKVSGFIKEKAPVQYQRATEFSEAVKGNPMPLFQGLAKQLREPTAITRAMDIQRRDIAKDPTVTEEERKLAFQSLSGPVMGMTDGGGNGLLNVAKKELTPVLTKLAASKTDDVIGGILRKTFNLTDDTAIKELTPLLKEADTPAKVSKIINDYNTAVKPPVVNETSNFFKEIGNAKETGYLNTKRLGITDDEAKLMRGEYDKARETINNVVGKKVSNDDIVKLANETQQSFNGVIDEATQKEIIAAQYNLSKKIAEIAKDGSRSGELIDFLTSDKSLSTFSGRLLQARKIAIEEGSTLAQKVLDDVIRVTNDMDKIKEAAKGLDLNDPKVATEFYRKFIKPNAGEWIDILRYNSMLSNPTNMDFKRCFQPWFNGNTACS
jgi:hypothetical protein